MSEKKDAYVQKLRAKVDEFNAEIDKFSAKADQAQADLKLRYLEQVEELKGKRDEAATKLEALQAGSESAWDEIKDGLEESFTIWKDSFSKAKAAFEQGFKDGKKGRD